MHKGMRLKTWNKLELNIGNWNVRSLCTAAVLKILIRVNQLSAYNADTVALQEICWTGSGILEKRYCKLFYRCDNKDHTLGTGFLVSKRIKHLTIGFKPITPRICTLRIRGTLFNFSFVNVHAPTKISDDLFLDGVF
jgi:exonuclease III